MPGCSEDDRKILESWASSRTLEARLVERARIVLQCLEGKAVSAVARNLKVRPNTVIDWRRRFEREGMPGLQDRPRSGKPRRYTEEFRNQVLTTLEMPPPRGQASWDGPAVAIHLNASVHAVWRVLRKEGICLSRQRSWCVSTDPEFAAKAADIVGLYLNPPEQALVLSVDEKPSIQALERATGYVETDNGTIVRGLKSTYKRHGTLNLFAALEVATGAIRTQTTQKKRRVDFLEFMDHLVSGLPAGKEIHVILDNYCIHKKNDAWLAAHPTVSFHFTPTSASWLNQVEIWFGILARKALRGASFRNLEQLRQAIEDFVAVYGPTAKPFVWRKREVKGSQLRNTIINLRN
ncbi:MAG: IS630 family transposase [candidate division NC10 bacterium]|nr:IS630 family transposase [candidate division NC10 bacterium]MDE2322505.1 IS630 family transposase [candidate division NC10 bacterium]